MSKCRMECATSRTFVGRSQVWVVAFVLAVAPNAMANRPFPARYDNGVNGFSAAAGVAAFFSGPAAPFIVAGGGGFEVGWWVGRTILDPPDTVNAGVPVNVNDFLSGHQYPSFSTIVPGGDSTLTTLMDQSMDDVDLGVALARSVNASLDRHQGALIIGNPVFAAQRLSEAQSFLAQLKSTTLQWSSTIPAIVTRMDQIDPGMLDNTVSQADARSWRDATAAGQLPTLESFPWSVYAPASLEHSDIIARAAALTDASIDVSFGGQSSMTLRSRMLLSAEDIAIVMQTTSIIPEPSSVALLVLGLFVLTNFADRKRGGKKF